MQTLRIAVFTAVLSIHACHGSRRRKSTCQGGGGQYCGSAFSHFHCPGKCCHDDFNAWCCPVGPWKCSGTFKGHDHCDNKQSCKCYDTTYYMTKVEAQTAPKVKYMSAWELRECCAPSTGTVCGWGAATSMTWTKSQTVSWSNTVTGTLSVKSKESLVVEGLEATIELSDSYTNGEANTATETEAISTPCYGTFSQLTHLNFTAQVAQYEVPVTVTYSYCGSEKTMSGTVVSTIFIGNYNCDVQSCTTAPYIACSVNDGCVADRRLSDIYV